MASDYPPPVDDNELIISEITNKSSVIPMPMSMPITIVTYYYKGAKETKKI